eukprot:3757702-Prymnesium_polylepis.1
MPHVNVFEYIGLTRATETAVLVSARGEVTKVRVANVPAALHAATNGLFKLEWAPHVHGRAHITFERLDEERNFAEMRAVLGSDAALAAFLRCHMQITSGVWDWNFTE